jgi:aminoglycoside/choline kinase family phosphotransferase
MIAKLAPTEANSLVRSWKFGRREVLFYQQFAAQGPLQSPACYFSAYDERSGNITLLLEDLSAARSADQQQGASREDATLALEKLAAQHAHFWKNPALEAAQSWLKLPNDNRDAFSFFTKRAWKSCATRYPELVTNDAARRERLSRWYPACLDRLSEGPTTLLHGDFRLDNLFFSSPAWAPSLAVIDWQLAGRGRGAWDVGNFLVGSLTPSLRQRHEKELLGHYWRGLGASLCDSYPFEELTRDYDAAVLCSFTMAAVLVESQLRNTGEVAPTMEAWLLRASEGAVLALDRLPKGDPPNTDE